MVTYDENVELDLSKFDIYNQYRDQVCFMKIAKKNFNVNVDPDNWQELKNLIKSTDTSNQIDEFRNWLTKTAPESYGLDKEFDFSEGLLKRIIESLKDKFLN